MKRNKTKSKWLCSFGLCVLTMFFLFSLKSKLVYAAEERNCAITIPISVELKENAGDTVSIISEEFNFTLEALDGENSEKKQQNITIDKKGVTTGRFAEITYTEPGDYRYKVYEQKGNNKDIIYDDSVYEVTVRVINAQDGGLIAEIWAVKDESEQKVDEIRFINYYQGSSQVTTQTTPETNDHTTTKTITRSSIGSTSAKTGDRSNLFLWSAVAFSSIICVFFFVITGKRRKTKE